MKGKLTIAVESIVVRQDDDVVFEAKGINIGFESEADAPSMKAVLESYAQFFTAMFSGK